MNEASPKDLNPPDSLAVAHQADVDAHADADPRLAPGPITIGGMPFTVRPMKVRQFFPFLKLARPMLTALTQKPSSPPSGLPQADAGQGQGGSSITDNMLVNLEEADWLLQTMEEHGPNIIKAMAIGTDNSEADIGELEVVDLLVLIKHFIVVNASFFTARGLALPPNLPQLQGVAAAASRASQASS